MFESFQYQSPLHLLCICIPPDTVHWDKTLLQCGSSVRCRCSHTVRRERSDLHSGCTLRHRNSSLHIDPGNFEEKTESCKSQDRLFHTLHSGYVGGISLLQRGQTTVTMKQKKHSKYMSTVNILLLNESK